MKKDKIIYWVTTSIIFILGGLMVAISGNSKESVEIFQHLGYPDYFRVMLNVFKILGSIVLILPMFPARIKEWAYFGFALDFFGAFISLGMVYGFNGMSFFPLILVLILIVSNVYYYKVYKPS
jgi:hypothetical protein